MTRSSHRQGLKSTWQKNDAQHRKQENARAATNRKRKLVAALSVGLMVWLLGACHWLGRPYVPYGVTRGECVSLPYVGAEPCDTTSGRGSTDAP